MSMKNSELLRICQNLMVFLNDGQFPGRMADAVAEARRFLQETINSINEDSTNEDSGVGSGEGSGGLGDGSVRDRKRKDSKRKTK